jgi:hypothetical protein
MILTRADPHQSATKIWAPNIVNSMALTKEINPSSTLIKRWQRLRRTPEEATRDLNDETRPARHKPSESNGGFPRSIMSTVERQKTIAFPDEIKELFFLELFPRTRPLRYRSGQFQEPPCPLREALGLQLNLILKTELIDFDEKGQKTAVPVLQLVGLKGDTLDLIWVDLFLKLAGQGK